MAAAAATETETTVQSAPKVIYLNLLFNFVLLF